MLYNGERIGDGSPPEVDIAVDPVDGTTLTAKGRGNAAGRHRAVRAGHHVRPGPVRLHGEDRRRPGPGRRRRHRPPPPPRTCKAVAKAKGSRRHRRHRRDPRAGPPRRPHRRGPRGRRPHPPHPRRRRRRRHLHRLARLRRRHPVRHRRHARGRDRRRRPEVHGRRARRAGSGPATTRSAHAAVAAGYDLDRVLRTDDLVAGDNCFFAATGITDGELLKGVHFGSDGVTTQSLVMRSKSGTVRLLNARHRAREAPGPGRPSSDRRTRADRPVERPAGAVRRPAVRVLDERSGATARTPGRRTIPTGDRGGDRDRQQERDADEGEHRAVAGQVPVGGEQQPPGPPQVAGQERSQRVATPSGCGVADERRQLGAVGAGQLRAPPASGPGAPAPRPGPGGTATAPPPAARRAAATHEVGRRRVATRARSRQHAARRRWRPRPRRRAAT